MSADECRSMQAACSIKPGGFEGGHADSPKLTPGLVFSGAL